MVGLPDLLTTTDPAWLANETPRQDEGWSLVCEFDRPPAEQGNPSLARVHYLFPHAPHSKHIAGTTLQLFEQATSKLAILEILD